MHKAYNNILIVCWDFPPNKAIGGRRWAKISKSLLGMGHAVSVICKEPLSAKTGTSWIDEATLARISLFYCKVHPLVSWLNDYASVFSPIKIRIAKWLLGIISKGTIFDKAIGIEKKFLKLVLKVIENKKIDTIFVTGAPFNLVYYSAQLKHLFPAIKIVCDYRDPWLDAQNYGMKNLSPAKRKEEEAKQNLVFETVDYISAPNAFLLNEIKNSYCGNKHIKAEFRELPHAFDPDDVIKPKPRTTTSIKIIYAGTLYLGVDEYLLLLRDALNYIKDKRGVPPQISIYTDDLNKREVFGVCEEINFFKPIGESIFEEIASADYILIILSHHNRNYLTSKFFEFIPYHKPYIYLGPPGFVSETIEKKKLGFCLKDFTDLHKILNGDLNKGTGTLENTLNYSFDVVVRKFLNQIEL